MQVTGQQLSEELLELLPDYSLAWSQHEPTGETRVISHSLQHACGVIVIWWLAMCATLPPSSFSRPAAANTSSPFSSLSPLQFTGEAAGTQDDPAAAGFSACYRTATPLSMHTLPLPTPLCFYR